MMVGDEVYGLGTSRAQGAGCWKLEVVPRGCTLLSGLAEEEAELPQALGEGVFARHVVYIRSSALESLGGVTGQAIG